MHKGVRAMFVFQVLKFDLTFKIQTCDCAQQCIFLVPFSAVCIVFACFVCVFSCFRSQYIQSVCWAFIQTVYVEMFT